MEFENKKLRSVAEAAARIMMGEKALHPNQQKLDVHEPEKDKLTADDFKKLRSMKKEETMHEESCDCGDCPSDKNMKKEEVELDEAPLRAVDSVMGHPNLDRKIPAKGTPGSSEERNKAAAGLKRDRSGLGSRMYPGNQQYGVRREEVDLDEGKMGQLDADLKDLSHDDFHKEYGKPKSHYDPSNFKKPVQKGKEMDRAKSLAQRGMASVKKEEVVSEMDYGGGKSPHAGHGLSRDDDDGKKEYTAKPITRKNAEIGQKKGVTEGSNKEYHVINHRGTPTVVSPNGKMNKNFSSTSDAQQFAKKKNASKSVSDTLNAIMSKEKKNVKEEVEELDEMFPGTPEYEKKYGKAPQDMKKGEKKKTTQGEMEKTGKGVVHRRKFSEMVESYTEGGVKGLFRVLAEEPTSAEFDAQLADAKQRAAGTKKQPEVSKPAVQAVQNEEIELTLEDFTPEELEEFMQTEEYEQLDELSKELLGRYKEKANKSAEKKYRDSKTYATMAKNVERDANNRTMNVMKASKKLAVEEQTHTTVSFIDYNDVNGVKYAEIDLSKKD